MFKKVQPLRVSVSALMLGLFGFGVGTATANNWFNLAIDPTKQITPFAQAAPYGKADPSNIYGVAPNMVAVNTPNTSLNTSMVQNYAQRSSVDESGPWGVSARKHASDMSRAVFELVNQERARAGLRPLHPISDLAHLAGTYSADMIQGDFFGHSDPSGRDFEERVKSNGLSGYTELAENLFNSEGQITWLYTANARDVVQGWMESTSGHREAVLDPNLNLAGVGSALRDGRFVVAMVFGRH